MLHTLAALMPFAPGDPSPAPFLTNSPTIDMQSPFPDDSGEPTLYINSGARVGSSSAT